MSGITLPKRDNSARREMWARAFYRFRQSLLSVVGLTLVLALIVIALLAPWIVPYPEHVAGATDTAARFIAPGREYWFGTNALGQDMFSLVVAGSRVSLFSGLAVVAIAIVVGGMVGAVAGYFGGWVDDVLMRVTEAFQTIPSFVLLLVLVAIFGSTIQTIVVAIGVVSWTAPARMVRAEFMSLRAREFVDAARNLGVSHPSLIFREILPNALPPVIVFASVVMATSILMESALAFLSLGDPNYASWGNIIGQGRAVLRTDPHCTVIPGIAILLTVLSFSLMGEGLNDVLNPRQKQ